MKNAIVTGANRGIGLSIIEEFAKAGINVWACSRTESEGFEREIAAVGERTGARILPLYFDITDQKASKAAAMRVFKEAGGIDILVNNAGISDESLFLMTSIEKLKEVFEVNFFSPLYFTQIVARLMAKKNCGSIVNIASVSGAQNGQGKISYGSSKAALIFATKTMSIELGQYGIRVNSVSPGFIDTDMWSDKPVEFFKKVLSETPLMRQGNPQEVAKAVLFLAGDDASYITGSNLVIDGGRMT